MLGAEEFYIAAGATNVAQLLVDTFQASDYAHESKTTRADETTDALDELAVDEAKQYKAKISKWIGNALTASCDVRFWYLMFVAHQTRQPLLHFYRWLCSKQRPGRMAIVELVGRRGELCHQEFISLMNTFAAWMEEAHRFAQGVVNVSKKPIEMDFKQIKDMAASLLLQNAACFSRRVLQVYQRYAASINLGWIGS